MNYQEILNNVKEIVEKVGAFQLEAKRNNDFKVSTKGDNIDYVTDIDLQSEKMIVSALHEKYPDHAILAEESGFTDKSSDYTWVIDPIDGTTNYVHNFPLHSISIGLKHKDETVLGIVELPRVNMRFTAIKGEGAFLNGEHIGVSDTKSLGQSILGTGFPYSRKEDNPNLEYFNDLINDIAGIRRSGSCAVDLSFVAAGMLDGYWEFDINEWDMCAGLLLIEEAGGVHTVTKKHGKTLVITANKAIHDLLIDRVLKA